MSALDAARSAMADAIADDPFISITAITDAALERIQGADLDRRWLDELAFEVSETVETCF
ncbi:MAG: hypothetical protein EOM91_23585 [Sphingobacteriia bacterium]|nr:hypothetical protein [Sphingobacteriia bacterium]